MAKIRVLFKGLFQQIAGKDEERFELDHPTLEGLVGALESVHGKRFTKVLRDSEKRLSPGVTAFVSGKQFPGWEAPLADGDEVTFLHFIVGG